MIKKIKNIRHLAPYDRVVKWFLPIIPERLKPNHLTFIRLVFTPVLIIWLVYDQYIVSLILFAILALTDMLDGSLARLRNQITSWGEIWDPIADKVLVGSVIVILLLRLNLSLTILILSFEAAFVLGGAFQKMGTNKNVQVKANSWGKIKMNLHCFGGGFLILGFFLASPILITIAQALFYMSLFFAALSLIGKGI